MRPIVEVRIPTYKRNQLLTRALESLCAQTHNNWKAIIFDDSEEGEGEVVVKQFRDERLIYKKNPKNLGMAANIDQAFRTSAYTQADYAFVLEDDNVLYPEFIERNILASQKSGCSIVRCDQEYWVQDGGNYYKTADSILTPWFEEGIHQPKDLWVRMLFTVGISNGGLFWRTDAKSNLQIGPEVADSNLQEGLRCLRLREEVYILKKSLAKYTFFNRPCQKDWSRLRRIKYIATHMAVAKILVEKVGSDFFSQTYQIALKTNMLAHWEFYAARLGFFKIPFKTLTTARAKQLFFKEVIRSFLFGGIRKKLLRLI